VTTLGGLISTANDGGSGSARSSGSVRGVGWEAGVTYHDYQALKVGDAAGLQQPTAYAGFAGDVRLFVAPAPGQVLSLGYQGYEDRDVPRTDAVESGRNLRFDFDPQRRQLLDLDWRGGHEGGVLESWRVNVNVQRWDEGRVEVRPNRPAVERELYDRVDTWGAFAQATVRLGSAHRLTGGAEVYHDWVYSRRNDVNTTTGVTTIAQARYPTDSTWTPIGVFLQDEWTVTPRFTVVAGLRYSRFELHTATRTDSNPIIPEKDSATDQVTGSLAASYEILRGHRLYASVAQGFRAPNVDDTTVFDRAASGIEVPNANLVPEQELAYELGWKAEQRRWHGGASVFLSDFTDLIQRVPGTFNGSPTIDGLPVSTRENVADATMKGFEVWGEAFLGRGWSAFASASYVHGDNDATGEPLNKIPPLNGIFGARWTRGDDRLFVEPFVRWAGRQTRISQADKDDFRIGPNGTPGWWTANLRAGYTVNEHLEWVVEAGNLLDERYKHHGSGVEDAGRFVTFGVQIRF
jgi:outer membrane receptor protein involved in Fe transport